MDDIQEYQIRVWDLNKKLLYVTPTNRVSKEDALKKAAELLILHGGASFTVEAQLPK